VASRFAFAGSTRPNPAFRLFDDLLRRTLGERAAVFRSNKTALLAVMGFLRRRASACCRRNYFRALSLASDYAAQLIYIAAWTAIASVRAHARPSVSPGNITSAKQKSPAGSCSSPSYPAPWRARWRGAIAQAIYGNARRTGVLRANSCFRPACWARDGRVARLAHFHHAAQHRRRPRPGRRRRRRHRSARYVFVLTGILLAAIPRKDGRLRSAGRRLGPSRWPPPTRSFARPSWRFAGRYNETTSIPLGPRPVYIGGGDDHVSIWPEWPEHAVSIALEHGRIRYTESASGRKTDLKDGSRIQIGRVELVIQAKKLANHSSGALSEKE
jgi:hypothetical protein